MKDGWGGGNDDDNYMLRLLGFLGVLDWLYAWNRGAGCNDGMSWTSWMLPRTPVLENRGWGSA